MKYFTILLWFVLTCPLIADEVMNSKFVYDEITQQPIVKLTYRDGLLVERCFYQYNEDNEWELVIIDNGTSEDPLSLEGATERLTLSFYLDEQNQTKMKQSYIDLATGEEKIIKEVTVSREDDLLKEMVVDGAGNTIEVLSDPNHSELSILECPTDGSKKLTTFFYDENSTTFSVLTQMETGDIELQTEVQSDVEVSFFTRLSNAFYALFHRTSTEGSQYINKIKEGFESFLQFLMRPGVFRISGYHTHPPRIGVHGMGEVNDKVRVTFINGILNYPKDQTKHLEMFSEFHGGTNIHHVLRPCEGWSVDMFRCAATKLGIISNEARTLAKKWKELIAEMGGPERGGVIYHYAHSIGGTETDNAKRLMTPEELKMIRVYALASPSIVHGGEFQYAINYVSMRDGVCYLDPIDFFGGLSILDRPNIVYVGTIYGVPMVEHLITSPVYKEIIKRLGDEFVQTYGTVSEKVD